MKVDIQEIDIIGMRTGLIVSRLGRSVGLL